MTTSRPVLPTLIAAVHVGVVGMLVLGCIRLVTTPHEPWQRVLGLSLALCFAEVHVGWLIASRLGRRGARPGVWWLGVASVLWVGLMIASLDFSWLAFPLYFLHLYLLRTRHALLAIGILAGLVIAAGWWHRGHIEVATVLGPLIGAVVAVAVSAGYQALARESDARQQALDQLRRTQAQLVASERDAGRLAERERMSREIHDTLAQGLSSIVLVSRAGSAALARGDVTQAAELTDLVHDTAAENLAQARAFVADTAAPGTSAIEADRSERDGIQRALTELVDRFRAQQRATGVEVRIDQHTEGTPVPLAEPVSTGLLRAAQVGLDNALRHAGAQTVHLTLGYHGDEVTLDVIDDGRGFDPTSPPPAGSFGLAGLRARSRELGGALEVESAPGRGSALAVRLPVTP